MSKKLYDESDVQALADAIRSKNGLTTKYKLSEMPSAIYALSGGVQSETVTCDYTNDSAIDFYRTKSGTPLYAELTSNADTSVSYGESYWIKGGFFFFGEGGTLDPDKSYYTVCEDGMGDYTNNVEVTDSNIFLYDPPSYSTLYGDTIYNAHFLPNTGDNPVTYTIKLTYG